MARKQSSGRTQFGQWLAREMQARRHTDRSLSVQFRGGVTHVTIGRWRRGEFEPTKGHIAQLAQIFGVSRDLLYSLLGRTSLHQIESRDLNSGQLYAIELIVSANESTVRAAIAVMQACLEQQKGNAPAESKASPLVPLSPASGTIE